MSSWAQLSGLYIKVKTDIPLLNLIRYLLIQSYFKMNSTELKLLQAPLKSRYKEEPAAALVTLKAEGKLGDGISCRIETGKALALAGLHPASGGNGQLVCSGDLLLEALVACAGVTLNAVATSIEVEIKDATVKVEGDIDFRGTLGILKEAPVGFKEIRLQFIIESDADPDKINKLLKLTERYCIVFQTLTKGVTVQTEITKI